LDLQKPKIRATIIGRFDQKKWSKKGGVVVQEMVYTNRPLSTQTSSAEHRHSCNRLPPLAAAAIARRREMASLPPPQPPQVEICLSPLLWSESFGLLVDG
jgi:hypothetical protein